MRGLACVWDRAVLAWARWRLRFPLIPAEAPYAAALGLLVAPA